MYQGNEHLAKSKGQNTVKVCFEECKSVKVTKPVSSIGYVLRLFTLPLYVTETSVVTVAVSLQTGFVNLTPYFYGPMLK